MSVTCEIEFENSPMKVAYPGYLLKGNVIVKLKAATVVRGVYLRLFGERVSDKVVVVNGKSEVFPISQKCFDERIICFDGTPAKTRLTSGNHRYSFECQLMTVIPVTVVESGGLVRYRASIRFDELWDSPPIHEEEFTVAKPLDLNLFPRLKDPFSSKVETTFIQCCLPFVESDKLRMEASIPQQGYIPGECISLRIDVLNNSSEDIAEIKIQLIKVALFKSTSEKFERRLSGTVCELTAEGFKRDVQERKTYRIPITVPQAITTGEHISGISVYYKLRIIALVGFCHEDPIIDIPITIGTHPIIGTNNRNQIITALRTNNDRVAVPTPTTSNLPSISSRNDDVNISLLATTSQTRNPTPSAPPCSDLPTYEEATSGNANTSKKAAFLNKINKTFRPKTRRTVSLDY